MMTGRIKFLKIVHTAKGSSGKNRKEVRKLRIKAYRACLVLVSILVLIATIVFFQLEQKKVQTTEKSAQEVSAYQLSLIHI